MGGGSPARRGAWGEWGEGGLRGLFSSSLHRGCCPERAAGRLPGAGQGVRGAAAPLHPLHPRTPRLAVTWKLSLESGCTLSAACRMGHRREPSPACGRGDVRACFGDPSALRASGIAFAPAPSLHQRQGAEGLALPEVCRSGKITGVPLPGGNRRRTTDKGASDGSGGGKPTERLCRAVGRGSLGRLAAALK